jgi:hypothetical protein
MTWIKFALWLSGMYVFYYTALILWDAMRGGRSPITNGSHELTFVEHVEPIRAEPDTETELYPSAVISSGGVSLKQMFGLAREEAIEYTKTVSFYS